jgi:hypothetical protein
MAGVMLFLRHSAEQRSVPNAPAGSDEPARTTEVFSRRPGCWLAVKTKDPLRVKQVLGLLNPKPCPLLEGLEGEQRVFISPAVEGWVLVTGSDLPEPSDDVDACYRFIVEVSRCLGHVQFYSANPILQHHAWIRADRGRVLRAYAWAGQTLWHQGKLTPAEGELDLKCFDYGEECASSSGDACDWVSMNVEKLPLLAARWSLDPGRIEPGRNDRGIAGQALRRF